MIVRVLLSLVTSDNRTIGVFNYGPGLTVATLGAFRNVIWHLRQLMSRTSAE
jgi:hypothetical protein